MRLFVVGGTGFIGNALVRTARARGDEIVVLSRSGRDRWGDPGIRIVTGDAARPGPWRDAVEGADAAVNLAGVTIVDPLHPWTGARKRLLTASRIEPTRGLASAIRAAARPPGILVNASGVNYYGSRGDTALDETAPPGDDFLATLCVAWEDAARTVEPTARVVCLRSAPVLGEGGDFLARLLPVFKLGVGGPWGSGDQWLPWIHVADEVGIILHAIDRGLAGPLNLCAPEPVTVREFAASLGTALGRPAAIRVPAFALRLGLGEAADALLGSVRAMPSRAREAGYRFRFPDLAGALRDIVL